MKAKLPLIAAAIAIGTATVSCIDMKRIAEQKNTEKFGEIVTNEIAVDSFCNIVSNGNVDVKYTQSDDLKVTVKGHKNVVKRYTIAVADGVLHIERNGNSNFEPSLDVYVQAPTLSSIELNGAGDIDFERAAEFANDLAIACNGAADIAISNLTCNNFSATVNGAGDIDMSSLTCLDATFAIQGAGDVDASMKCQNMSISVAGAGDADITVDCDSTVKATTLGAGDITIKGNARKLIKNENITSSVNAKGLRITE